MQTIFLLIKSALLELFNAFKKPLLFAIGISLAFFLLTPIFIYAYFAKDLISKETIINNQNKGVILYDRNNQPFFNFYEAKRKKVVTLDEVPIFLQQAIISVEDKDFYKHPGFSIPSIIRAFYSNLANQEIRYGASTITQQLVKNSLLSPKKSFLRKYQEIILAFEIERLYNKREILEMYLNSVYLGEGAVGVGTGALAYFSKDVKDLTLAEATLLAAILPAPSRYSPISGDMQKTLRFQRHVLSKMVEQGYVNQKEKEQAQSQNIYLSPTKTNVSLTAPHFALMVKDQLLSKYSEQELALSGLKIVTTINLNWQKYAEETVNQNVKALAPNGVSNGAAVVINPKTSEILAMVGSSDWFGGEAGKINMAIAPRQSGSAFKPIVYAKAFADNLITPGTILKDIPTTFEGNYKPKNYDGRFRGNLLPRKALANSINVPAVEVMSRVGVTNAIDFAKQMGIGSFKDPSNYGLSMALGAAEIPLLELTNAYAVFANQGTLNPPIAILEIRNKMNEIIYTSTPSPKKVLESQIAFLISSILSDNLARAEIFGNLLTIDRPAAVKTGTTENYKDALTIGYTPSLVVGVWVGNSDNRPMDQIAGSLGAAPIWKGLMMEFLKGKPVEKFEVPSELKGVVICNNGQRVNGATNSAYMEYFISGTEPTGFCENPTPQLQPTNTQAPTSSQTSPTVTPQPTLTENDDGNKKDKKDKDSPPLPTISLAI